MGEKCDTWLCRSRGSSSQAFGGWFDTATPSRRSVAPSNSTHDVYSTIGAALDHVFSDSRVYLDCKLLCLSICDCMHHIYLWVHDFRNPRAGSCMLPSFTSCTLRCFRCLILRGRWVTSSPRVDPSAYNSTFPVSRPPRSRL